jgi:hypothetical protein
MEFLAQEVHKKLKNRDITAAKINDQVRNKTYQDMAQNKRKRLRKSSSYSYIIQLKTMKKRSSYQSKK